MIRLLDCTTRDGGHCTNWNYSDEYIFNLMADINSKNISYFEIGYRNHYERADKGLFYYCTPNLIKKFYEKKENLHIGIMVDTKRYNENDFINANEDYVDFVRIATHPDKIQESLKIAETLNDKNYNVMIQLMDITNIKKEHYDILENWQNKSLLNCLYLADTYGIINAIDLETIFNKIKNIGYKNIGFHAHNKTRQALSNSIKASELGAYLIDVTQDSNGINGGNLSYIDFITSSKVKD